MSAADVFESDFDAAAYRLRAATPGTDEFRRALKEVLAEVYAFREHRKNQRTDYYDLADRRSKGRASEGLVAVRNVAVHHLATLITVTGPKQHNPSRLVGPAGPIVAPQRALTWLSVSEMTVQPANLVGPAKPNVYYQDALAGREVFGVIESARGFLVSPGYLGPL